MCTSPLIRYRLKKVPTADLLCKYSFLKSEVYTSSKKGFTILGKKKIEKFFSSHSAYLSFMDAYCDYIEIPCGNCEECKKAYARDWSVRCYHESLMHDRSCFITLTIDSLANKKFMEKIEKSHKNGTNFYCKHCQNSNKYFKYPIDYSLNKVFILDWLKKLRDYLYRTYKISIRYFGCGEYGSKNDRPHYHILIFGYDFPSVRLKNGKVFNTFSSGLSKSGYPISVSEELSHLWSYGRSWVEELNLFTCMYVSQYCMKKIKSFDGEKLFDYYYGRVPEFLFMSKGNCQANRCKFIDKIISDRKLSSLRDISNPYCKLCNKSRGGLGFSWFWKNFSDIKKMRYIQIGSKKFPIPKYYKDLIKLTDIDLYDSVKSDTIYYVNQKLLDNPDYNSSEHCKNRKVINRRKSEMYNCRDVE